MRTYALPAGDIHSLSSIQTLFETPAPSSEGLYTDAQWIGHAQALQEFRQARREEWSERQEEIEQEAGQRKLELLIAFAHKLAGSVTNSDMHAELNGALAIAGDSSITAEDRVEALLDALDTIYAIFTCSELSDRSEFRH